jgi:lambda repressor-like predicted transcriptional regulator
MKHMPNSSDIKAALKNKKISQLSIARILGVHPVSVNEVVSGKRKNPRIRLAIALSLGRPVSEIWPEEKKNTSAPAGRKNSPVGDVVGTADPSRG